MFGSGMNLEKFCCRRATLHIQFQKITQRYLLVFSTTFMCEHISSPLIINKQRNRLDVSNDMRLAMNNIHPIIKKLVIETQTQKSQQDH